MQKRLLTYFTFLSTLLLLATILSCQKEDLSAQQIVDKAIAAAGGEIIDQSSIHFKFRKNYYRAARNNGTRILERCTDAECLIQKDVILEDGEFVRFRESAPVMTPDSMKNRYLNSVNSVHYFSVLPYGLNDPAVRKTLLDEKVVKGTPYYRIKVTFKQEGGGQDFDDEYLYWIHKENYGVDYLAYKYQVNGGGTRFREAYNMRIVNGVRFVDYNNYEPVERLPPLSSLDSLFENGNLTLLSKINLEEVSVILD